MIIIKSQFNEIVPFSKDELIKTNDETVSLMNKWTYEEITLGVYSSEERAKEVMKMIEEHISENYASQLAAKAYDFAKTDIELHLYAVTAKNSAIFTMPNE